MAGLLSAAILAATSVPAYADNLIDKITVNITPVYDLNATGDANLAPPAGYGVLVGYNAAGNAAAGPNPTTSDLLLNYSANIQLSKETNLFYSHTNSDFTLGRILEAGGPGVAIVTGDIADRNDTVGLNYVFNRAFSTKLYYFDTQRTFVSGLTLNQNFVNGVSNPSSIDFHGYGIGGAYGFGPRTKAGYIFTATFDGQYVPRPGYDPAVPNTPAAQTAAASGYGLNSWTGSGWVFPYGVSAKIPLIAKDPTLLLTGSWSHLNVWWRAEATPEAGNVVTFGAVKALSRNLTLSLTDINLTECTCTDTLPPPETVRFAQIVFALNYRLPLKGLTH
ncbi:MAG: hypothetical protein WCE44_07830 [Candidatus Velthaea sp.]